MAKASKRPAKKAFAPKLPDSLSAKRKGDIAIGDADIATATALNAKVPSMFAAFGVSP